MKIRNSFLIAKEEIRNKKLLFLVFSVITILLFSVSVAIMEAAVYLPEHISKVVHDNMLDCFFVNNYKYPDEIKDILDEKNIDFNIESCNTPFYIETADDNIYGGVLFQDYNNENANTLIMNSLADGLTVNSFFKSSSVIISDEMAKKNDFQIGESIDMIYHNKDEKQSVKAEIFGIYEAEPSRQDYYISDEALNAYFEKFPDNVCCYVISPKKLRNIFSMKNCLEQNGYVLYSKETINTIRMLYITLYSINIILLLALAGSVYNFMNIYLQGRKMFYAVQSAIGMSDNNILKILFCISELIIAVMLIVSLVLSSVIMRMITGYAGDIFANFSNTSRVPFIPGFANFLIVQFCLIIIILKFRKRLKNNSINKLLHEK